MGGALLLIAIVAIIVIARRGNKGKQAHHLVDLQNEPNVFLHRNPLYGQGNNMYAEPNTSNYSTSLQSTPFYESSTTSVPLVLNIAYESSSSEADFPHYDIMNVHNHPMQPEYAYVPSNAKSSVGAGDAMETYAARGGYSIPMSTTTSAP